MSELELMEQAGQAVAQEIVKRFSCSVPVLVLAGAGNNGGDALVTARYLHQSGFDVATILVSPKGEDGLTPSTRHQLQRAKEQRLRVIPYQTGAVSQCAVAKDSLLIIDGLLGLGFTGKLNAGPYQDALAETRALTAKSVVAIDLPSGLSADAWQTASAPLPADLTVTFGGAKPCLALSPARQWAGEVIVRAIDFSPAAVTKAEQQTPPYGALVQDEDLAQLDPFAALPRDAHKFDRGHVLVIGGSEGKLGAPIMAGLAALRAGAGWVSLALPSAHRPLQQGVPLEMTLESLFDGGRLDAKKLSHFVEQRKVRALVIGPGTVESPLDSAAMTALANLVRDKNVFVVIDGGALHGVGDRLEATPLDSSRVLLTPHPGEWRKLTLTKPPLELETTEQVTATLAVLRRWGASAIYKSATQVALAPDAPLKIQVYGGGTNVLAKAGSGDILAGVSGVFGAQGLRPDEAALKAQWLIATTANRLARERGQHGVIATDIIAGLAHAMTPPQSQ